MYTHLPRGHCTVFRPVFFCLFGCPSRTVALFWVVPLSLVMGASDHGVLFSLSQSGFPWGGFLLFRFSVLHVLLSIRLDIEIVMFSVYPFPSLHFKHSFLSFPFIHQCWSYISFISLSLVTNDTQACRPHSSSFVPVKSSWAIGVFFYLLLLLSPLA